MTWPGGNCPACGEAMPSGVVRCRYCHSSLTATSSQSVHVPDVETAMADSLVTAGAGDIDDFLHEKPASVQPEKKVPKRKRPSAVKLAPPRPPVPTPEVSQTVSSDLAHPPAAVNVVAAPLPPLFPQTQLDKSDFDSSSWRGALWLVALLLLAPLSVSGPVPGASSRISAFVRPMIHSGDEPHYLVLINSVVRDGDIDVSNNYADVHRGGDQAGRKFAGWAIDHHVNWYWHWQLIHWWEAYETQYNRWNKDADGHPTVTPRTDSPYRPPNPHEYSQHPPGLAWVLAPFVWVFRKTSLLEPAVLVYSSLATIAGMWAFYQLLRPSGLTPRAAVLLTAVTFLGTPLWHYARALYAEPYLMACAVGAYAACLRFDRFGIAGLLLGIAALLKIPFVVVAAPLILNTLFEKRWAETAKLSVPILVAIVFQFICNQRTFGAWWKFPQKWESGYPLLGLGGLMFSWQHGLLLFSPIVLISLFFIPKWIHQQRREAVLMGTGAILYLIVMATWAQWWGGTCYSSRLILPIVPFLMLPMASLIASPTWTANWQVRALTWTVALVSVGFNAIGAFSCEHIWDKHPIQIVVNGY